MEVRIKDGNGYVDADWTIEDGVMVVSPKEVKKYWYEPKDGELVTYMNAALPTIYIYRAGTLKNTSYYATYSTFNQETFVSNRTDHLHGNREDIRPATEEEKKLLFDKLAEKELAWDAEKKELVKLKWKPKNDELYCRPMFSGGRFTCYKDRWDNVNYELFFYNKGWVFKTEQECQEFCNRLNEAINSVKP